MGPANGAGTSPSRDLGQNLTKAMALEVMQQVEGKKKKQLREPQTAEEENARYETRIRRD